MREQDRKQRTIEAIEKLIHKYKYPSIHGWDFLNPKTCPLCKIHKLKNMNICRGCPLASVRGSIGCIEFNSFKSLVRNRYDTEKYYNSLQKRGQFYEIILPIVRTYPMKVFTEIGWRYFSKLDREW